MLQQVTQPTLVVIQKESCPLCREWITADQKTLEMPMLHLNVHRDCAAKEVERHFIYSSFIQDYGQP